MRPLTETPAAPTVHRIRQPEGELLQEEGLWEARWEDGVSCQLVCVLGAWGVTHLRRETKPGVSIPYYSEVAPPIDAQMRTRRELLEVLTEWRSRDLDQARG